MRKARKFAENGGQARVLALVLYRFIVRPILIVLLAVASALWMPITAMAAHECASPVLGAGGKGLEVITGFVTAPGATFTGWTLATGNSLQIRSADTSSKVLLVGAWGWNQVAGVLRVRSPRLHDFQQGIRMRVAASLVSPMLPIVGDVAMGQPLVPQDTLTVEQTGSAVAGNIEVGSLLVYYDSLPGIGARFTDAATVQSKGANIIGQEVSITTGTAGGYSGQVAINSSFDNFKANTDYALLGIMTDVRCCTVRVQGVDSGNLGIGVPGEFTMRDLQNNFFVRLSGSLGMPLIPVFNSANKSAILVDAVAQQAAVTVVATLFMVEMPPNAVAGAATK